MSKRDKRYKYFKQENSLTRNRLLHLLKRFTERHAMSIGKFDIDDMLEQINSGVAERIKKKYNQANVYRVVCQGKQIAVVYSKARNELITTFELTEKQYEQTLRNNDRNDENVVSLHEHSFEEIMGNCRTSNAEPRENDS